MSDRYLIFVIICMSAVTLSLRVVPFLCMNFFKHRPIIIYLGRSLPGVVMVILVVFSVKDAPYFTYPYGIPQLSGISATLIIHAWRRNIFISIVAGVTVYALSIHFMVH